MEAQDDGGVAPTEDELAAAEQVRAVAARFLAADAYIISCPMWNFHIPYTLKHYLDVLVQPGLTFGFDPAKGYFGLVPNRPVQLVLSRAGSYAAGTPMAAFDQQRPYLELILGFIGLTDVRTLLMECTAYGPEVAGAALEQAIQEARVAATTM